MDWERHFRSMKKPRVEFGSVERGVMPPGVTDSRVIPPGRYWLDVFGGNIQLFQSWLHSKPEVHVETSQEDTESSPPRLFAIFTIPSTASNFGMSGVLFPTNALGFPSDADATIHSSEDTVQKPSAPTSADILADITGAAGKASGSLLSNIDTKTLFKFAMVAGVVILVATFPSTLLRRTAA